MQLLVYCIVCVHVLVSRGAYLFSVCLQGMSVKSWGALLLVSRQKECLGKA